MAVIEEHIKVEVDKAAEEAGGFGRRQQVRPNNC